MVVPARLDKPRITPKNIQKELERCTEDEEKVMKNCELVHGVGRCERINKFTWQKKCPMGYVREDHTRCKRNCDFKENATIINFKCWNQKIEYINTFDSAKDKETCLGKFKYCREKDMVTHNGNVKIWIKKCPPNTMKLSFMCIPYCMSEMSDEILETLSDDPNFCVEDYVDLGVPFYDFN